MKKNKLKLITKILAIIVICLISFIGIYVQKNNRMENVVKDFTYAKDLTGYRQVVFELSNATEVLDENGKVVGNTDDYSDDTIESNGYTKSETLVNNEEDLKVENYELSKDIIEKRLKSIGVQDYTLSLDKKTGKLYLQIPEDTLTDTVVSNITEKGNFEIKDSENGTVYITAQNLKDVKAMYNTTESGTTVYLEMKLNKEGTSILKDLSTNEYATIEKEEETEEKTDENEEETSTDENEVVESEEETTEEDTTEEETTEEVEQKQITLVISGNEILSTSFDDPIEDGKIDLSMNSASTDNEEINETLKTTSTIVTILENGELPLEYTVTENQYVKTDITEAMIRNTAIVAGVVIAILLVIMIIKNKLRGLLGAISYIGFVALYLLLIRYTNVAISIPGMIAIAIVYIINYITNMKLLTVDSEDKKTYKQEYFKFIAKMIPLLIISILFIFVKLTPLNSFGMLLFWGIVLMMLYNIAVTKNIVD